jgi:hypothetical protein
MIIQHLLLLLLLPFMTPLQVSRLTTLVSKKVFHY